MPLFIKYLSRGTILACEIGATSNNVKSTGKIAGKMDLTDRSAERAAVIATARRSNRCQEGEDPVEAQLERWSAQIDRLASKAERPGVVIPFDYILYIDELKALRAIAQAAFDAFLRASDADRPRLEAEWKIAWSELGASF